MGRKTTGRHLPRTIQDQDSKTTGPRTLHRSTLEDRTKKHTNGFTRDAAEKLGQAKLGYLLKEKGVFGPMQ